MPPGEAWSRHTAALSAVVATATAIGMAWRGLPPAGAQGAPAGGSPDANLPPHIRRLTFFGERADFSHDGKRLLFLSRTFGDAYEYELETGIVRPFTHHYPHEGYTRALYLANGDILLSGAPEYDARNPDPSRFNNAELWVLDKSLSKPPVRLGEKCFEGPAVSRTRMRIAWTIQHINQPDRLPPGVHQIWMAEIETTGGTPRLANKRLVLDTRDLPFSTGLETQNFRPPEEKELIFNAYGYQAGEVMGIDLETKRIVNYSHAPGQFDEPEGIFPDGRFTCVESDRQRPGGSSQQIDIWRLRLDGSGRMDRLTYFNDYEGYKASNPVVSDDGRQMAFQMARVGDPAGFGRGIFLYDLLAVPAAAAAPPAPRASRGAARMAVRSYGSRNRGPGLRTGPEGPPMDQRPFDNIAVLQRRRKTCTEKEPSP